MSGPLQGAALLALMLMATAWGLTGCSGPSGGSSISVVAADDQKAGDQIGAGDALRGGTIRLYQEDGVVLEQSLDRDGRATITVPAGLYTLQAFLGAATPGASWGNTIYDLELPVRDLEIAVFQICSGSWGTGPTRAPAVATGCRSTPRSPVVEGQRSLRPVFFHLSLTHTR